MPLAVVPELLAFRETGAGRFGRIDAGYALHPGLFVHREHQGTLGWVQVEAIHVGDLLPYSGSSVVSQERTR